MVRYVGIDVGKARCRAAIMGRNGSIVDEFFFTNNYQGISKLVSTLTQEGKVVMESARNLWLNLYNILEERK